MGQQPNMPLTMADLPRPEPHPGPARGWRAGRPGDPSSPADVPWGGAFGTPGPDTGYALRLLRIELAKAHGRFEFAGRPVERRRHHAAWSAPRGPEVHDDRNGGVADDPVEITPG